jgi:hypothetical protein
MCPFNMNKLSTLLFSIMVFVVPQASVAQSEAIPEIAGFESWKAVTSEPIPVPEYLFRLCRVLTPGEAAVKSSPHRSRHVRVRVNPKGEETFYSKNSEAFPVGSVIVKEKFLDGKFERAESLGVMLKSESGWDFIYKDEDGQISQGRRQLENCYACHASLKERDQVFRTYLKK